MRLDLDAHLVGGGEAIGAIDRERLAADAIDLRRHVEALRDRGALEIPGAQGLHDGFVGSIGPELRSGGEVPEHHPRREDVGAPVDRLARRLFGRHVPDLALADAAVALEEPTARLREPEVDDLDHAVVGDEHVVRSHVTMRDGERTAVVVAQLVGVVKACEHLGDHRVVDVPRHDHLLAGDAALDAMERLPL